MMSPSVRERIATAWKRASVRSSLARPLGYSYCPLPVTDLPQGWHRDQASPSWLLVDAASRPLALVQRSVRAAGWIGRTAYGNAQRGPDFEPLLHLLEREHAADVLAHGHEDGPARNGLRRMWAVPHALDNEISPHRRLTHP